MRSPEVRLPTGAAEPSDCVSHRDHHAKIEVTHDSFKVLSRYAELRCAISCYAAASLRQSSRLLRGAQRSVAADLSKCDGGVTQGILSVFNRFLTCDQPAGELSEPPRANCPAPMPVGGKLVLKGGLQVKVG